MITPSTAESAMLHSPSRPLAPLFAPLRLLRDEARIVHGAALTLVAAVSPATYDAATRRATAEALYVAGGQALPGYALLALLVSAVVTHIIATTAAGYNLSHLALDAVILVFVVELIPLSAALFVAVRSGLDCMARLANFTGNDPRRLRQHIVPSVIGNAFAVIALATISCVIALLVAYFVAYGTSPWGLSNFNRLVGQAFDPVTAPIFAVKILLFGLAVALVPASIIIDSPRHTGGIEMRIMARLLLMLVLIEVAALALKRI